MRYCKDCDVIVIDAEAISKARQNGGNAETYFACPYCGAELNDLPEETSV